MLALLVQVHSKTCKTLPMMQYLKSYPFILIIGVDEYESELVILHFGYSKYSRKNISKKLEYEKEFC